MRRLLLVLLVFVLPLRALAGDLMVLGMATNERPEALTASMAPDCEMHRAGAGLRGDPQGGQTGDGMQCGACSLCLPVVHFAAFPSLRGLDFPEARPSSGDADFLSAPLARSFRPPSL